MMLLFAKYNIIMIIIATTATLMPQLPIESCIFFLWVFFFFNIKVNSTTKGCKVLQLTFLKVSGLFWNSAHSFETF